MSQAEGVAHRRQYQRLAGLVDHLRIEVLLKAGQVHEVEQLFALAASMTPGNPAYDPVNLRGSSFAALEARLLLEKGAPDQALKHLDAVLGQPGAAQNVQRSIRLTLQKLRTLVALGDSVMAGAVLNRLALTHRIDFYRLPFVEEGPALAQFVVAHSASLDPQSLTYRRLAPAMQLIADHYPATRPAPWSVSSERVHLTDTETLVMTLLEQGKTNKEIARNLTVTDNTIKYHLGNIFRKLGVKTRTAAITHAREIGLLAAAKA